MAEVWRRLAHLDIRGSATVCAAASVGCLPVSTFLRVEVVRDARQVVHPVQVIIDPLGHEFRVPAVVFGTHLKHRCPVEVPHARLRTADYGHHRLVHAFIAEVPPPCASHRCGHTHGPPHSTRMLRRRQSTQRV